MTEAATKDAQTRLRWSVYWILIVLSVGSITGRIFAVNSVDRSRLEQHLKRTGRVQWQQQRPFLSSNDRSRWATVRALVENGTYAVDEIVDQPNWDTIDMVKHADGSGTARLYSSKPPLLATLIAGPYWVIHRLTGWTLGTHPYEIGRSFLIFLNISPLIILFLIMARLVERFGNSDWARIYVMAAATCGTFLTTFAVVLNNHLIAAVSAALAMYTAIGIWCDDDRRLRTFAITGLFAAFTVTCELPALIFFAIVTVALLAKRPRETLMGYVPMVVLVAVAFFGTNYAAHQSLRPPYMHRSATDPSDHWYHYTYERGGRVREGYWNEPQGIDRGEPSRATYALHVLAGHHGIFSLTPVWLLTGVGLTIWGLGRGRSTCQRSLAILIVSVTVTCLTFYIMRPQPDRNYGGMTSGFRWMFWMAPMWLLAMLPAADACAEKTWKRAAALVMLAISVLSASYPTWNPWTHPWITQLLLHFEWIHFE